MNRLLKFKQTDDSKVYFSSDFHLNHNPKWPIPIWKSRGYESVSEMNDAIIKSVNDNVRSTDILFFLGDFCLNTTESQFEEFLSRINCQQIYILFGNHNSCIQSVYEREVARCMGGSADEVYPFNYRNLIYIGNYQEITVDGNYFVLQHFPIHSWNYMKNGSIHGYGHQHCKNNPTGGKRVDFGWDRDKRPYSADEIINLLKNVPILSDGGHH